MKYIKYSTVIFLSLCVLIGCSSCVNSKNRSHRLQWWLKEINWEEQNRTNNLTGKDVSIAVIDTAIDTSHPDLADKHIEQYIVGGVSGNLEYEHGTAVAGIICASPSNSDGVLGIAENAKILSIVISNDLETHIDSLVEGIKYAIDKKVNIINISAGIVENNLKLQNVIEDAYNMGIVVVAASGNNLYGTTLYPAKYDNVISVDSIDIKGQKLYGENSKSVFLPGANIVTTYSSTYEPKKYVSYSGTSMSAPMLSAVISLILEQNSKITNKEIVSFFNGYQNTRFNTVEILESFKNIK